MAFGGWQGLRLQPFQRPVALFAALCTAAVGGDAESFFVNTIEYVWPMVVLRSTLEPDQGEDAAEVDRWRSELAAIGETGFQRYLKEILPSELKLDQQFAAEFQVADESRWNLGFFRWQKRVYSKASKISTEELLWDGKPVPALKGVDYDWAELHKPKMLASMVKRISTPLARYKKVAEANLELGRGRRARFIPWVEVYRPGEFQRPHTHTGSPVVGIIALRCGFESQRMAIEDPRGINPPFGRKYTHAFKQGDVLFFPSWTSHLMEPNRHNETNIFLSFAVQGQEGVTSFDWEDDGIGALVKTVKKKIKVQKTQKEAKGQREEL